MEETSPTDQLQRTAIAAASALANGTAELLRYAREGDCATTHYVFALEPETIEQLADGLKLAIEIEIEAAKRRKDREGSELLGQLAGACARFIEGWS